MKVLVTVGSTEFRPLISLFQDQDFVAVLMSEGYREFTIQYGTGFPAGFPGLPGVKYNQFESKPSLAQDIANADLVITHGGAGTCLEVRRAGKLHIAVANPSLMNNHQWELVSALDESGCACGYKSPEEFRKAVLDRSLFNKLQGLHRQNSPSNQNNSSPGSRPNFGQILEQVMHLERD